MKINGNLIDTKEIVGISDLMREYSTDAAMWSLYKRQTLFYLVYCKTRDIRIQSGYLDMAHPDENCRDDAKVEYNDFKCDYQKIYKEVAVLIGEPEP